MSGDSDTWLMEVIRTTERVGFGESGVPVHQHVRFVSLDGELLAETCGVAECDAL